MSATTAIEPGAERSLPETALRVGLAGWSCALWGDSPAACAELERRFSRYRCPVPGNPGSGVELRLEAGLPRLRLLSRGRPCGMAEVLAGPEWKRIIPSPHSSQYPSRTLFTDQAFGGEPALEACGEELVVLRPSLWPLYVHLGFLWLLLREAPVFSLHAGVAASAGTALVLVGASGSGKSTLLGALVEAGADYFGDEWAFFTLPDYHLHALPRELCLRPGGMRLLEADAGSGDWYELKPGDRKCAVRLPEPERPCPADRVTLYFMDGFREAPECAPLGSGEAARRLLQGMGCGDPSIGARLDLLAGLVERYPCRRLRPGPPAATAALLLEQAGSCAP